MIAPIAQPGAGRLLNTGSPLARGLRAFWPMSEGTGAIASDVANGGSARFRATCNPGALTTLWDEGPFGRKPVLAGGSTGQYLTASLVSTKTNNVTFGCWLSAKTASQLGRVLFVGNQGGNGWGLYQNNAAGAAGTSLSLLLDGVTFSVTASAYTIVLNRPTFAVATCRGTTSWRLFIDGQLFSVGTGTALAPTVGTGIGASSSGFESWGGWVDRPFVAERAWSDAEVYQAYLLSGQSYGLLSPPARRLFAPAAAGEGLMPVSSSDFATGAESATLAVAVSGSDGGVGSEAATLVATPVSSETGTAAEGTPTVLAILAQSDGGSGAEAVSSLSATVSGSDTSTGTEGTPTILAGIVRSDAGTGADASTLAVAIAGSDAGAGAEAYSLVLLVSSSDAGTGAEGTPAIAAAVTGIDAASGVDASTLVAALSRSDSGTGTESGSVFSGLNVSSSDSGSGTEGRTLVAALSAADAGAGADVGSVAATLTGSDAGTGADSGSVFAGATKTGSDAGTGAEGPPSLVVAVAATDSAFGSETAAVAATLTRSDSGTGVDSGSVVSALSLSDSGAGVEDGSLAVELADAESGTGAEAGSAVATGPVPTGPRWRPDPAASTAVRRGPDPMRSSVSPAATALSMPAGFNAAGFNRLRFNGPRIVGRAATGPDPSQGTLATSGPDPSRGTARGL